jgi:hypothetical protein
VANSCSLLLLDTLLRHAARWVRYQPLRHMVLGHTNPFSTILCGRLWVHKGKVGGVPGLVRGGAGRGARYSSGTLGGD